MKRLMIVSGIVGLMLLALAACITQPAATSQGVNPVMDFKAITVSGQANFNGPARFASATTALGDAAFAANVGVSGAFYIDAQPVISVTDNATVTPTGSYQPLESAGWVTASLSTSGYSPGTVLTLINTANTTVTFTDTGTLKSSGNVNLGQYDAAQFWFDGTNWIQTGESDN